MPYQPVAAGYASPFAQLALANIAREYPNKPDLLLLCAADLKAPRMLHPVFYGSYDWHSAVHMHWLLVRLMLRFPELPERRRISACFDAHFTDEKIRAELDYLHQPGRESFERPYGWGWLLKLQAELIALAQVMPEAARWREAVQPLADAVSERFLRFLPLARYPVRSGTHGNSAFAMLFALDYAHARQHLALRQLLTHKAHAWFGHDRRYPAAYEPGGEDFLSAGLVEAALMLRVTDDCSYADWWELFCPAPDQLLTWLTPVVVSDRSDARLAHLDGLNLSRAWCWKLLQPQLPQSLRAPVVSAIDAHLVASLPHAVRGHYVGTHWLASFALLVLTED